MKQGNYVTVKERTASGEQVKLANATRKAELALRWPLRRLFC